MLCTRLPDVVVDHYPELPPGYHSFRADTAADVQLLRETRGFDREVTVGRAVPAERTGSSTGFRARSRIRRRAVRPLESPRRVVHREARLAPDAALGLLRAPLEDRHRHARPRRACSRRRATATARASPRPTSSTTATCRTGARAFALHGATGRRSTGRSGGSSRSSTSRATRCCRSPSSSPRRPGTPSQGEGAEFIAATRAGARGRRRRDLRKRAGKDFLVRKYDVGGVVALDNPWLSVCISRLLLDIANEYLQLWSKLEYIDLWYSLPVGEDAERKASQIWHRDFDDSHLLKAFLYLSDVDERSGPFEYVPGSHPEGQYAGVHPWAPMGDGRISDPELAKYVPADDVRTFTAPTRHADPLQHERPPPRRFRRDDPARARDGDVLLAGLARVADRAELRARAGVGHERVRPGRPLRAQLSAEQAVDQLAVRGAHRVARRASRSSTRRRSSG